MTMSKDELPADRFEEYKDQLKDLGRISDPERSLTAWERDFIRDRLAEARKNIKPTLTQANKMNEIYEMKYLRGVHGGKR